MVLVATPNFLLHPKMVRKKWIVTGRTVLFFLFLPSLLGVLSAAGERKTLGRTSTKRLIYFRRQLELAW